MGNQVKPVRHLLASIGHGWLHCVGHVLSPHALCRTLGDARICNPEFILKVALEWGIQVHGTYHLQLASGGEGWLKSDVMPVGQQLLFCLSCRGSSVMHCGGWLADWSHWCGSPNCGSLLDQLLCRWFAVQCIDVGLCIVHPDFLVRPVILWILLSSWMLCSRGLVGSCVSVVYCQ